MYREKNTKLPGLAKTLFVHTKKFAPTPTPLMFCWNITRTPWRRRRAMSGHGSRCTCNPWRCWENSPLPKKSQTKPAKQNH